jgi:hypothetical protein
LPILESEYVLEEGPPHQVALRSASPVGVPLCDAETAAIRGSGYPSEQEAIAAGEWWRDILERAFAATGQPVDFGDRSLSNISLGKALTEPFEQEVGRPLLPDSPRMMVFRSYPEPAIMGISAKGTVRPAREPLDAAIALARASGQPLTERARTAYTYFAASHGEMPTEAQYVLVMMAVEALIDQQPRPRDVIELVDGFRAQVRQSGLDEGSRSSLLGQLGRMREQSIGEAGKHLAVTLGDREYGGMSAVRFFTRCYTLRSRLVHLDAPGPERGEVEVLLHPLRQFVSDLIAGPALVAVVERTRKALAEVVTQRAAGGPA